MFCDNKSDICIAHDPANHNRTKHIEIDRFYIKEKIEKRILCVSKLRADLSYIYIYIYIYMTVVVTVTCKLYKYTLHLMKDTLLPFHRVSASLLNSLSH